MTEAGSVGKILREIPAPNVNGLFHVSLLPGHPACYVGRDASGNAALLLRAFGQGRTVPLRLAGIEARFAVPSKVAEPGANERTETLTAIVCLSRERGVETYFAGVAESLVAVLPPEPTTAQVADAVDRLVELFQKLRRPARGPLAGLVGEICLLREARDAAAAITGWHSDPEDRYDFVAGRLRLDIKASTDRHRAHSVSFEQANPPPRCLGLLASIWIEAAGGGTSVAELLRLVEGRLTADHTALSKFRTVVADVLGETFLRAMEWRFDLALARSSLMFYDATVVPAVRPPLPAGVSGVRFISDFGARMHVDLGSFARQLDQTEAALLPDHLV